MFDLPSPREMSENSRSRSSRFPTKTERCHWTKNQQCDVSSVSAPIYMIWPRGLNFSKVHSPPFCHITILHNSFVQKLSRSGRLSAFHHFTCSPQASIISAFVVYGYWLGLEGVQNDSFHSTLFKGRIEALFFFALVFYSHFRNKQTVVLKRDVVYWNCALCDRFSESGELSFRINQTSCFSTFEKKPCRYDGTWHITIGKHMNERADRVTPHKRCQDLLLLDFKHTHRVAQNHHLLSSSSDLLCNSAFITGREGGFIDLFSQRRFSNTLLRFQMNDEKRHIESLGMDSNQWFIDWNVRCCVKLKRTHPYSPWWQASSLKSLNVWENEAAQ